MQLLLPSYNLSTFQQKNHSAYWKDKKQKQFAETKQAELESDMARMLE